MEKLKLKDWILENFAENEYESVLDEITDNTVSDNAYYNEGVTYQVSMGYRDEEDVANAYFEVNKTMYSLLAYLYKYKDVYILVEEEECAEGYLVFRDLEEAKVALNKLDASMCLGIDEQIEDLYSKLGENNSRLDVQPKREYNNGGHFYSFDIYLDENLILDGQFRLYADEIASVIKDFDDITSEFDKHGIDVDGVSKHRDRIGFERYYTIKLSKLVNGCWEYLEEEVHICGTTQGQTKKIADYIDIDYIISEFDKLSTNDN